MTHNAHQVVNGGQKRLFLKKKLEPECNPSVMREIFNSKKLHGVPSEPQRWLGGQQKDHALRF